MERLFLTSCLVALAVSTTAATAQLRTLQGIGQFERKELAEPVANAKAHKRAAAWCRENYSSSRYMVLVDGFYRCNVHPRTKEYHCKQELQMRCETR